MSLCIKDNQVEIRAPAKGMVRLYCEGKCVGFAATLARAVTKAGDLRALFKLRESSGEKLAVEQITKATAYSVVDESPVVASSPQVTAWVIDAYCWNGTKYAPVTVAAKFGEEGIKALLLGLETYHQYKPEITKPDELMNWRDKHPLGGKAVHAKYFRAREIPILSGVH
ncbi:hypothetical protein LU674_011735 [Pseudomonas alloputida]|uniref:Uncharacterized protein n=1 Tax=Pseudomonas alloputida TaxID=1940621 RepID=A0AAW7HHL5_9PSED|nr:MULTISPECIES: hypothetical protein [Pseudomonas]MCE0864066.1 hypothetical protein [Pseudomonas alloputida]MCE0869943.1 hypothetical protein [Pseudomonas alloputida]MCE0893043.1 hypothetical protein [Pseudomonas alloputida]MCE0922234.1 hypothetical protein [Pseudomonas alloputida]MCE1048496.1 hypothetical protein [Pseudomonas alloputida]